MFKRNGKRINEHAPIEHNNVRYRTLRDMPDAVRIDAGVTEVPDAPIADDRFFWDGDITQPKDVAQLKAMLRSQVNVTARALLSETDWMVIRAAETPSKQVPAEVKAFRANVRDKAELHETAISSCTSAAQLSALTFEFDPSPVQQAQRGGSPKMS